MNRFSAALMATSHPAPDMMLLSQTLYSVVTEATALEKDPNTDPAVVLLSMHIGFMTNADVSMSAHYDSIVKQCRAGAHRPTLSTLEIH